MEDRFLSDRSSPAQDDTVRSYRYLAGLVASPPHRDWEGSS